MRNAVYAVSWQYTDNSAEPGRTYSWSANVLAADVEGALAKARKVAKSYKQKVVTFISAARGSEVEA